IVTANIASLASNATATITVTVTPLAAGTITNSAVVSSGLTDPFPGNNSASVVTTVNPAADLAITHSASPSSIPVLSNTTFTIVVTNRGPSPAPNVVVSDAFPPAFTFVSATPIATFANGYVTWSLGTLANGQSATLTLVARAMQDGTFANSATVTAGITDLNPNNTANASVTVTSNADAPVLKITRVGNNVVLSWAN